MVEVLVNQITEMQDQEDLEVDLVMVIRLHLEVDKVEMVLQVKVMMAERDNKHLTQVLIQMGLAVVELVL